MLIVIGGDDEYKEEDDEEQVFISRWARRKVESQFDVEYLDGRKSFIFSWNKTHRKIHEEALFHYFDPSKNGKKFQYQPKLRQKQDYGEVWWCGRAVLSSIIKAVILCFVLVRLRGARIMVIELSEVQVGLISYE